MKNNVRRYRLRFARAWIHCAARMGRIADWFHSFPVVFLSADELVALTSQYYCSKHVVAAWQENALLDLTESEEEFIKRYGFAGCRIFIPGSGAGREAVILAQRKYRVTAIDVSEGMVRLMDERARKAKVIVDTKICSIYDFHAPAHSFDMVMMGLNYGFIPTRDLRVTVLRKMKNMLTPQGKLLIAWMCYQPSWRGRIALDFGRIIARLVNGNREVEEGDRIYGEGEFHHCFAEVGSLAEELYDAGFIVESIHDDGHAVFAGVKPDAP